MWRFTKDLSKQARWVVVGLFAFVGLDSVVDAMLPMSCSPSADPQCSLLTVHSFITNAHMLESTISGVIIGVTPYILWWLYRAKHQAVAQINLWFGIMQIVVGLDVLTIRLSGGDSYGIIMRIYESGLGAWVGILAAIAATEQPSTNRIEETSEPTIEEFPAITPD
jgi:hypothetical protein